MIFQNLRGYTCAVANTAEQLLQNSQMQKQLLDILRSPTQQRAIDLGGRRGHVEVEFPGVGHVVVKPYGRGGVLGRFVRRLYFRLGPTRPEQEFRLLELVRTLGVNAPEPLAWIVQGRRWYCGWLVTRRILNARTLAEVSVVDEELAALAMRQLEAQLSILIRAKIFHVDFHPGNVLVTNDGSVFLIDFDKAHYYTRGMDSLRDRYLCRWRRAVIKHQLPEMLAEHMSVGLRKSFERLA